ncbi:ABC transporter permease [Streptomyces sediminimaris]|uniref:ABC transporter permease n=1 Tax=Streptomyces sediminimaris TaxID=3383721 RepID=UPI003999489F
MSGRAVELTGTVTLTRFLVRRERVRIALWIVGIPLLVLLTAAGVKGLYPTQHDLDVAARGSEGNAAAIAFNGPPLALDTMGGQVAFQTGTVGLVVVALMSVFTVGRQTRGEEEAGRAELVRALPTGRHASVAAALLVVGAMNVVVAAAVTLGLLALRLPAAGSVALGLSFLAVGLVFAAFTTVAAQVSENTRVVHGGTGAVLGLTFVLRAVGDVGDGRLSWLSPIGWVQKTRPYAGERWWPLLLAAGGVAGALALASALAARRDLGAGLVPPRPGPPRAAPRLGRPLGLALRLQRGSLIGWSCAVFLTGIAYGWVADDVQDLIGDNDTMRKVIAGFGETSITDAYLTRSLLTVALVGAGFAVQAALRPRGEESALRAEPVLAAPVSRLRWAGGHLTVAVLGSVVVLGAAGLGTGLSYALVSHDAGQVPRLVGAALVYAPALWTLAAVATALTGLAPRAVGAAWAVLGLCLVTGVLGDVLGLPDWLLDLSPFQHLPQLPAARAAFGAPAAVTAIAAALLAAGLAGFRHRDVG